MKGNAGRAIANLALAKKLREIADYDLDDALHLVGLRRRRSASARFFAGLGLVVGGMAVGTVLGLMLAPRAGRNLGELGRGKRQGPGATSGMGAGMGSGVRPMDAGASGPGYS